MILILFQLIFCCLGHFLFRKKKVGCRYVLFKNFNLCFLKNILKRGARVFTIDHKLSVRKPYLLSPCLHMFSCEDTTRSLSLYSEVDIVHLAMLSSFFNVSVLSYRYLQYTCHFNYSQIAPMVFLFADYSLIL